jgi:glutamate synthase domain-containing protein 3
MVDLERIESLEDTELLRQLIQRHIEYTGSELGGRVLTNWHAMAPHFVKVFPRDYRRVLDAQARAAASGREASFKELVGVAVGG